MNYLDIPKILHEEAKAIVKARESCYDIHGTDIRAAGNEVEVAVREFFTRMLPSRFHVSQGHLIDRNKVVSVKVK
jgi:hypothetical protein